MTFIHRLQQFSIDPVRQVQLFMVCRHTGVILASVVIARSLPLEEVGVFEMLMLCGYLMTFFWSDALLKGFLANAEEKPDAKRASSFLGLYVLSGLLAMTILVVGQRLLLPWLVGRTTLQGLELFAVYQVLIIPVWIAPFLGLLKGPQQLLLSAYVLIGPAFACWAGLMNIADISGIIIGLVSYASVGFVYVLTGTTFVRKLRLKALVIAVWPVTWPLMLYAVSAGLARSFDAWLVARYFDESSFAVFRYGAREFPLVVAFAAGLSTIMIPKLRSVLALEELRERSTRLMHTCYPIVVMVMFFSPPLFAFFFGDAYRESALIFNIYLLITLTQLIFPQTVMTARGDTRWLWYISLAELTVNILASLALFSAFGLAGIAIGTLIAFAFEKIALTAFVYRRYGIQLARMINPAVWVSYTLLITSTFIAARWIFGV